MVRPTIQDMGSQKGLERVDRADPNLTVASVALMICLAIAGFAAWILAGVGARALL
jgi:hypothetical protein